MLFIISPAASRDASLLRNPIPATVAGEIRERAHQRTVLALQGKVERGFAKRRQLQRDRVVGAADVRAPCGNTAGVRRVGRAPTAWGAAGPGLRPTADRADELAAAR